MTSAVVFDLFGTLTGSESQRKVCDAALASFLNVPHERLGEALISSYDERARGLIGDVRDDLRLISERAGGPLDQDILEKALTIRMDGQRSVLAPRAGALEVLQELRRRSFRIGVLSDCTGEIPELWQESEFAPLVDAAVFSCREGIRKPDKRMYERVLELLGADPADSIYVGDGGSWELSGANSAGIRAIMLQVDGEHFAREVEGNWTGEIVSSLEEVLDLLPQQ